MAKKWWRQHPKLVGTACYYAIKALGSSLNIRIEKDSTIDPYKPYLFAFWHGKQLLPGVVMHKRHFTSKVTMTSPSRDGAILAVYLKHIGFEVIRGSSRDNNIAALLQMRRRIVKGASMGFAVDGPLGPLYNLKPGIIYLAKKCNVPIIPMGSAFSHAWTFEKAWDKFQLPKPFAKAGLILDTPMVIPQDMDIEDGRLELERRLHQSEQKAIQLLK